MAIELAKAYIQIVPSARGIKGSLGKALGGEASAAGDAAGQSFGGQLVGRLKGIIAAAGIGATLAKAIGEGAELQQNLGGTEAVFGRFASNIQSAATEAYRNMGLSASDYMATANKMGSLFQGSGLEQQRAMELTSQAMQRAADVASVMGIDMQTAMESIAGAAKGNFTMMDNLGVAMNATTLEAYALEKGVNFKWATASNAEKAELAMQMFFDRTTQYADNFAKESEQTISGSLGAVKSAFQNVLGQITLGQDVGPALQSLAQAVTTFLTGNLLPAVWNILRALPGALITFIQAAIPQFVSALQEFAPQLTEGITETLPEMMKNGAAVVQNMLAGVSEKLPDVLNQGVEIINSMVTGVLSSLPQLLDSAMTVMTSFLAMVISNFPQILNAGKNILVNIVEGIGNMLPQIVASAGRMVVTLLTALVTHFPEIISAGFDLLVSLVQGIGDALPKIVTAAGDVISSIWDAITETDWLQLGKDIISGLINGIGAMAGALWDAAVNIARSALDAIKSFFGIKSPSRVMRDEVGKYIPAGIAAGIEGNTKPLSNAMRELTDLTTGTLSSDLAFQLSRRSNPYSCFGPSGSVLAAAQPMSFSQTIYTHDSLSESELTREAENFVKRMGWKLH